MFTKSKPLFVMCICLTNDKNIQKLITLFSDSNIKNGILLRLISSWCSMLGCPLLTGTQTSSKRTWLLQTRMEEGRNFVQATDSARSHLSANPHGQQYSILAVVLSCFTMSREVLSQQLSPYSFLNTSMVSIHRTNESKRFISLASHLTYNATYRFS